MSGASRSVVNIVVRWLSPQFTDKARRVGEITLNLIDSLSTGIFRYLCNSLILILMLIKDVKPKI